MERLFYSVPEEVCIEQGDIVEVELRNVLLWGIATEITDKLPEELQNIKTKPVARIIAPSPLFRNKAQTKFLEWLADYYIYPLPKIIKQIFSPFISKKNSLPGRSKKDAEYFTPSVEVELNEEQSTVAANILARWKKGDHKPALLFGVTGSGKSEVYSALCREVFIKEKQVLFLVPEISLTKATLSHLEKRLGLKGALIHSSMTRKTRFESFMQAYEGTAKLIVGTRSALLYPFDNIGLIIVDEEHDSSYKNLEPPYYNARDAAVMKGRLLDIPVILGSATPSSESYYNATTGKYHLEKIKGRANLKPLPNITIFDYKGDLYIPSAIIDTIKEDITLGSQSLFFLNRRGFATIAVCDECGIIEKCPKCDVALVYHKKKDKLLCHHCLYARQPALCTTCGKGKLILQGIGIEKLCEALKAFFPEADIVSVDRDSLKNDIELNTAVNRIEKGHHDIIVGTVMISKGHNFPGLRNVVIKFADYMLNFSDYKAAERCFQIVTQVAGRSGRFEKEGRVWVEAAKRDHYIWKYLLKNDYEGFIKEELAWRERLMLPPFSHLAIIKMAGAAEDEVNAESEYIYEYLQKTVVAETMIYPPMVPPLHRIHNKYRKVILISTKNLRRVSALIRKSSADHKTPHSVTVTFDVDAISSF